MSNKVPNSIPYFVNVQEFRGETAQLESFFNVITMGKAMSLRCPLVAVSKGNYNVALNVGSKDDQLVVKQEWYAFLNKKWLLSPPENGRYSLSFKRKKQKWPPS